jgi:peroxiredoxin Q/BCP
MNISDTITPFPFVATSGVDTTLQDCRGKKVVLYFYPKDDTSGCTAESIDFTTHYDAFVKANTMVFGISRESLKSHEKFKAKFDMPFELISDPDEALCKQFDVMKEKSMYGKKYMGIERSTFIIDENGVLTHEWRKVKVPGHVEEVLAAVAG